MFAPLFHEDEKKSCLNVFFIQTFLYILDKAKFFKIYENTQFIILRHNEKNFSYNNILLIRTQEKQKHNFLSNLNF